MVKHKTSAQKVVGSTPGRARGWKTPSVHPAVNGYLIRSGKQTGTPRDALAPRPWSRSFGWCLAEGYGNGDQRRPMSLVGSGRTLLLLFLAFGSKCS